jgi:hypothetical protein
MSQTPSVDLGQVASSLVQRIISGENVTEATKNILTREGERVCYEGFIQRMYDNRWMLFGLTAATAAGLMLLGGIINRRIS